jgi:hypothetical protein
MATRLSKSPGKGPDGREQRFPRQSQNEAPLPVHNLQLPQVLGRENENRWVRLRVTNAALRLIDKVGIEQVVADLRARGEL